MRGGVATPPPHTLRAGSMITNSKTTVHCSLGSSRSDFNGKISVLIQIINILQLTVRALATCLKERFFTYNPDSLPDNLKAMSPSFPYSSVAVPLVSLCSTCQREKV